MSAHPLRRPAATMNAEASLRFSGINAILMVAGLLSLTLGYVLLSSGSHVAAPLLLALGYVVLLPLAVIL